MSASDQPLEASLDVRCLALQKLHAGLRQRAAEAIKQLQEDQIPTDALAALGELALECGRQQARLQGTIDAMTGNKMPLPPEATAALTSARAALCESIALVQSAMQVATLAKERLAEQLDTCIQGEKCTRAYRLSPS
jgi:hypothetical protein